MRSFRIRTAALKSGERLPLLVDLQTGLPCAEPLAWLIMVSRLQGASPNTLEYKLRSLAQFLLWCDCRGVDLESRISSLKFLRQDEMFDLWEFMRRPFREVNGDTPGTPRRIRPVDECVHSTRLFHVKEFIKWKSQYALRMALDRHTPPMGYDAREAHRLTSEWLIAWNAMIPRPSSGYRSYGAREGLTPNQRSKLTEVASPSAQQNPFRNHQHRNYALIRLYLDHGLRLSEALALKVRDVQLYGEQGQIAIHRRHDDPEDPRGRPALVKTLGRVLFLTEESQRAIEAWLTHHRCDAKRYPGAKRSPYLFISGKGLPLSCRSVSHMFQRLRDQFPELGASFSPHVLRHDWNERWVEQLVEELDDFPRVEKAQKYAMGWSERSAMPMRYGQRAIQKLAARHTMRIAQRLQDVAGDPEEP